MQRHEQLEQLGHIRELERNIWTVLLENPEVCDLVVTRFPDIGDEDLVITLLVKDNDRLLFIKACKIVPYVNDLYSQWLKTRNKFIEDNKGLVHIVLKKIKTKLLPEDALQEGFVGLLKAVSLFDFNHGVAFSSYAIPSIRRTIRRASQNTAETVRRPVFLQSNQAKLQRIIDRHYTQTGHKPNDDVLTAETGLTSDKIKDSQELCISFISTSTPLNREREGGSTVGDTLPSSDPDPEHILTTNRNWERVSRLFTTLKDREREIILRRFENGETYQEIGESLGRSREGVRCIERRALRRLQV